MPKKKEIKKKVMSVAINPGLHEAVKECCKARDISVSAFVSDLLTQATDITVEADCVVVARAKDGLFGMKISDENE